MEYLRERMLQVEDAKFFQKAMLDLTNVDLMLQPIYNDVLKYRFRAQQLRSNMAEQCIPLLIEYKENLEERKYSLNDKIKEMKNFLHLIDDSLYEKDVPLAVQESKST